jgi:hypothetical protein
MPMLQPAAERRAGALLLRRWHAACRGQAMPNLLDLEFGRHEDIFANCFLLREDVDPVSSVFILCGERAQAIYGTRPVGRALVDLLPQAVQRVIGDSCRATLTSRRPNLVEGRYRAANGVERLYRGVFAPVLSDSPGYTRCGFLLGAYGERSLH